MSTITTPATGIPQGTVNTLQQTASQPTLQSEQTFIAQVNKAQTTGEAGGNLSKVDHSLVKKAQALIKLYDNSNPTLRGINMFNFNNPLYFPEINAAGLMETSLEKYTANPSELNRERLKDSMMMFQNNTTLDIPVLER